MAFRGLRGLTSESSTPEVFSCPVVRGVSTPEWNAITYTPTLDLVESKERFAENNSEFTFAQVIPFVAIALGEESTEFRYLTPLSSIEALCFSRRNENAHVSAIIAE
jgi:hypothetical protein